MRRTWIPILLFSFTSFYFSKPYSKTIEHNPDDRPQIIIFNSTAFNVVQTPRYRHTYHKSASIRIQPPDSYADLAQSSFTVRAVYFVNTKIHRNFDQWIDHQMSVFPKVNELYIVATSHNCTTDNVLLGAFSRVRSNRYENVIELECHDGKEETFEYHGINKFWELGQAYAGNTDIAIYFHSKGLTRADNYEQYRNRRKSESQLMERVFGPIEKVMEAFALFPDVDKAGARCSSLTFVWYNFMYVRGSYLNKVEKPIIADRRWYYEDWLFRWNCLTKRNPERNEDRGVFAYPIENIQTRHQCYTLDVDFYKKDSHLPNIGIPWHPFDSRLNVFRGK